MAVIRFITEKVEVRQWLRITRVVRQFLQELAAHFLHFTVSSGKDTMDLDSKQAAHLGLQHQAYPSFFYTPSLYLVLFGDFCFIYAKKNFEKLFLPTEYLTAELDQFHAKVSSHVKFVNGGDLFKTHVQTKPKWIRDYFIVSQRDDLEKFSNTTQLAKANKRLKCGVQFNDNGEIRVTKGTVSNVLDLLISYGGKDIVTGAFVKARKLTGRTKAEKLELEQRKVDS